MDKQAFLAQLRSGLPGLPEKDIAERLSFYSEIIDDRIEEGLSEEEAVSAEGTVPEIVEQIVAEIPFATLVKQTIKQKRPLNAWQIVLIVLGSPIWLSLAVAAVAVICSLYVCLWSVIISLWAVFASLIGCGIGGVLGGIVFACGGNPLAGVALIAAGIICTGLSIFMFYACDRVTKGIAVLTKKTAAWIKSCFMKKGEA